MDALMPILIGVWRRFHKESGPPDVLQTREFRKVVSSVKSLMQAFDGKESLIGRDYFANPDLLGAYILYNWGVHYQQALSLIGELPHTPRRVLDICSGAGPMALAALRHGASEVIALDQNQTALTLGAEICGRYGMPLTIRRWSCLKEPIPVDGKFDLIILGHCLEELFSKEEKEKEHQFLLFLLKKLTPQGFLLIVSNSYLESNRRVLEVRDRLVKEGVPVQAPCVFQGECPALKTAKSPCYAQREFEKPYLMKEIQRAAEINLGSLKMTYLIFRSPESSWPKLQQQKAYRVISPPVESFQGTRYYLCGTDGKKSLHSHFKEHPKELKAFEYLKRGELITVEGALEKQNFLDLVEGSKLFVIAPCGKPVPEEKDEDER